MLNSYKNEVTDIPFVYCHTGLKEDNGNRVYSISVCLLKDNGQLITLFDELVAYSYFTGRDRHYSNLSKKKLDNATQPAIIANELKKLLSKYEFVISLNNQNNHKDIRDYCGVNRVVDLRFATDYFLPYLEINSPKHLWEHLYKLKRDKVSFSSESIVRLQVELVKHICGYILNENNFNKSLYHYNQSLKIKQINFNSLMGISVLYLKNNELNKSLMYVNKANEILNIWIEKQNEELNLSNKFLRKSYNKNLKDCGLIQIHTIKYFRFL